MSRTVAIVEKEGAFGLISLDRRPDTNLLTNYDPRSHSVYAECIAASAEAIRRFEEAVAVTRDRGWGVVWTGGPIYG